MWRLAFQRLICLSHYSVPTSSLFRLEGRPLLAITVASRRPSQIELYLKGIRGGAKRNNIELVSLFISNR